MALLLASGTGMADDVILTNVNVSVSGPDGVVYNEWFTTPAARSVQVDLSPCQDGRYEILFFDAEGNEAEGSFLKEED